MSATLEKDKQTGDIYPCASLGERNRKRIASDRT